MLLIIFERDIGFCFNKSSNFEELTNSLILTIFYNSYIYVSATIIKNQFR